MKTLLLTFLSPLALFASHSVDSVPPTRPLTIPALAQVPDLVAELRSSEEGATYPVTLGVQITARIQGTMPMPATDPGRTRIQVELVFPLLAKDGRTVLLPAGTHLVGMVHLLHGELLFMGFQSCFLPDGRGVGLPEQVFRLGPGPLLALQDGTPALLTVVRPLRVEAFKPGRPLLRASARP